MSFHESCKQLDGGMDGRLSAYFTKTKAIQLLEDFESRSVVAVGLKGIGKSTAYRYLTEFSRKTDEVVIGVDPDKFRLNLTNKDLSYTACRKQFEHDIVIEALRAITTHDHGFKRTGLKPLIDEARREVSNYLTELKKFARRGGGISVLGCGFNLGKADEPVFVGLRQQSDIESAYETLRSICSSGVKVRIVVDDPEQVFSASRTLDTQLVGGFCLAAIFLSDKIPNLKIVGLFKTHIYQPMLKDVDDLTRYPEHMVRLRWKPDELVGVVQSRLTAERQKWSDIFEGTAADGKALIRSELSTLTRNGPRDLLHTLDIALQKSRTGKIGKAELDTAREKASQDSLDDLTGAYNSLYPELGDVVKAIFQNSATISYTLRDLKKHIQTLMINDHDMQALAKLRWMQSRSSQTLPELFFETGLLAIQTSQALTLPYDEDYTLDQFRRAEAVRLVPALAAAITAR